MIKKIIIFLIVALALALGYYFFFMKAPDDSSLVSSLGSSVGVSGTPGSNTNITATNQDFLTILLNVKNIKLDDSIFSDPAFATLHDSTIVLVRDTTIGRPNPFAPIGFEKGGTTTPLPASTSSTTPNGATGTTPTR